MDIALENESQKLKRIKEAILNGKESELSNTVEKENAQEIIRIIRTKMQSAGKKNIVMQNRLPVEYESLVEEIYNTIKQYIEDKKNKKVGANVNLDRFTSELDEVSGENKNVTTAETISRDGKNNEVPEEELQANLPSLVARERIRVAKGATTKRRPPTRKKGNNILIIN